METPDYWMPKDNDLDTNDGLLLHLRHRAITTGHNHEIWIYVQLLETNLVKHRERGVFGRKSDWSSWREHVRRNKLPWFD
jgi:hypothetical protein